MENVKWELLEDLCAIHAVSGREDLATRFIREIVALYADEVSVDNIGNVVGILQGRQYPDCRLMLQAHMDELGLIVRNITNDGFLLFERVGGIPEKSLLGQRVAVLTDNEDLVPGYVGAKSHHITRSDEKFVVPKVHDMFIRCRLTLRDDAAVVSKAPPFEIPPFELKMAWSSLLQRNPGHQWLRRLILDVARALDGETETRTIHTINAEDKLRRKQPAGGLGIESRRQLPPGRSRR